MTVTIVAEDGYPYKNKGHKRDAREASLLCRKREVQSVIKPYCDWT